MRSRWIPLSILALLGAGLTAAIVSIAVGEHEIREIRLEGTGEVQELIAGIPQLGNRLGADDAPVTINLFIDIQCGECATYMGAVVDPVIAEYVRRGRAKVLLRHRPAGTKPTTLAAFGAVAAAEQDRGWQYAEIFARNLDKVPEQGVDQAFLDEVAAVTPKLDTPRWERDVRSSEVRETALADDELSFELGIPAGTALVIESPSSGQSVTLVRSPPLGEVTATIERLGG